MNPEFVKQNCCNVLGERETIARATCMQQQLNHHVGNVMNNQTEFALKFLPEFIAVFECVERFFMGDEWCLIIYDTRFYHHQQRTIKTSDFLEWSNGVSD